MFDYRKRTEKIKRKYKEYEKFWLFGFFFFHINTDVAYLNVK